MMEDIRTMCCDSTWHVRGRADFRCDNCNGDVTLEMLLIYQALEE